MWMLFHELLENLSFLSVVLAVFSSLLLQSCSFQPEQLFVDDFIDVKGYKAIGKILDNKLRMSSFNFKENKIDKNIKTTDDNKDENEQTEELTLF